MTGTAICENPEHYGLVIVVICLLARCKSMLAPLPTLLARNLATAVKATILRYAKYICADNPYSTPAWLLMAELG